MLLSAASMLLNTNHSAEDASADSMAEALQRLRWLLSNVDNVRRPRQWCHDWSVVSVVS